MNDIVPAKKKRRRRNRRRGSGGAAVPAVGVVSMPDQHEALAAMRSFIPAVQVENRPGVHPDPYDKAAEAAGIAADRKAHVERIHTADELAALLLPLITQARHKDVFDWASQGIGPAKYIEKIVRAEIARVSPAYREAMGGGGSSSRDLEKLSERIPVRK